MLKSDCVEKQISSSIPSLEFFAILIYFVLHHFHFTKKVLVNYQTNNENIKEVLFPIVIIPSLKEITIWQHKSIKYHLFPFFGIYHECSVVQKAVEPICSFCNLHCYMEKSLRKLKASVPSIFLFWKCIIKSIFLLFFTVPFSPLLYIISPAHSPTFFPNSYLFVFIVFIVSHPQGFSFLQSCTPLLTFFTQCSFLKHRLKMHRFNWVHVMQFFQDQTDQTHYELSFLTSTEVYSLLDYIHFHALLSAQCSALQM